MHRNTLRLGYAKSVLMSLGGIITTHPVDPTLGKEDDRCIVSSQCSTQSLGTNYVEFLVRIFTGAFMDLLTNTWSRLKLN